jgi:hypothetical protein
MTPRPPAQPATRGWRARRGPTGPQAWLCWSIGRRGRLPGRCDRLDGHDKLPPAFPLIARLLKHAGVCSTGVRHAVPRLQDAALARPPKIR